MATRRPRREHLESADFAALCHQVPLDGNEDRHRRHRAYDGQVRLGGLRRAYWREPVRQQLLPGRLRRPAVVLLAACVAVTTVLGVVFARHGQPGSLDSALDRGIGNVLDRFPALAYRVAEVGNTGPTIAMTVALVLVCLANRRWAGAVLAAVAVPTASFLTEYVLKPLVGRTNWGALSFPSGHATGMFAIAGVCAILLVYPPRSQVSGTVRLLIALLVLLLASAVALAMVALGSHYFTDAVAGAAVGLGVVLACALALDLVTSRARKLR